MTFDVVTRRLPMPKNATQPNNVPADAPNTTCPARRVDRPAGAACEARLATDHDATANFHKYYPFGIFGRPASPTHASRLCRNSRVFAEIRWRLSHNFHFARTHTFWGTALFGRLLRGATRAHHCGSINCCTPKRRAVRKRARVRVVINQLNSSLVWPMRLAPPSPPPRGRQSEMIYGKAICVRTVLPCVRCVLRCLSQHQCMTSLTPDEPPTHPRAFSCTIVSHFYMQLFPCAAASAPIWGGEGHRRPTSIGVYFSISH